MEFALGMRGTGEEEQANGHASGIEACDKRRDGPRWHEGPRSCDIADGLRHGLLHVGAFAEGQLHQRSALNAFAIDCLNARDVEEMILVVIGKESFHLRGSHATIRLRDIDDRIAHLRENIRTHLTERQHEAGQDRDECDDHSEGTS